MISAKKTIMQVVNWMLVILRSEDEEAWLNPSDKDRADFSPDSARTRPNSWPRTPPTRALLGDLWCQ